MSDCKPETKPMVPLKTLDIIFRRRYVQNTQFYFTNRKIKDFKIPMQQRRPFKVPKSEKLLSYIKYSDRKTKLMSKETLSKPVHLKDNFKIASTRGLSERLFLEEPPDDVRAVVDFYPEFYTVIEGRPLRAFDDIKVYSNNIRNYAMNKQQIGYRNDLILKIEQNIVDEKRECEIVSLNFRHHIKNFQKFLTEDYKKACAKVAKAEKAHSDLQDKNIEYLTYVTKVTILNNILYKLHSIRSILKTYRSYLLFVAPITWRQKYDESLNTKIQSIQFDTGEFQTDKDINENVDIDNMIEMAAMELRSPPPAYLFFNEPHQMLNIFTDMEIQSREYLTQLSKTDGPYRMLQSCKKKLKLATKQELDYFQYYIDRINNEIAREEFNEIELQKMFYRILNGLFYDSVASPNILKLKICIEYVYEQIFGKCEEGHENLQDPMKILEITYEEINLKLDSLDFMIVNQARNDCFAQDLKMMKNAYKAARELRAFREMTNAMKKAFLPPIKFCRPESKKSKLNTTNIDGSAHKSQAEHKPTEKMKLSQEEKLGLLAFTNWCEGLNPTEYLEQYNTYVKPVFSWQPKDHI